ncbi:MAG TPA: DUF4249 family protein [Longimicrobium sp.]|nr:DUF4249 family protein [Longimicrobium sp.]
MIRTIKGVLAGTAALLAAGCDLSEVSTTPGEEVVVVEAVLRTDQPRQEVLLHRALQGRFSGGVPGAHVVVTGDDGQAHTLVPSTNCYRIDPEYQESDPLDFQGSCYASPDYDLGWVTPGRTYDLRVETADGRVIQGRTHVPANFAVPSVAKNPQAPGCYLLPNTGFTLLWTRSEGAPSYVADLRIMNLAGRLPGIGVPDPFELRGLAVSDNDTTIAFPSEFGVFERFNYSAELLKAIENGFPNGVTMQLSVAAVDRNWLNSVRGGNFNPSGLIRISTVVGDGVGVFGSLVVKRYVIPVTFNSNFPKCGL